MNVEYIFFVSMLRKCIENSMENVHTDVRVKRFNILVPLRIFLGMFKK